MTENMFYFLRFTLFPTYHKYTGHKVFGLYKT
jgi:hypothetical protein